ncbi:MAG: FtsQ-type POTRA domain-containing protein, partial [Candidatus Omnitrophica bacterium]|nr:FtsQ-type POTRA domain-containing protein [Candidatus Omnitrophota bacterium]
IAPGTNIWLLNLDEMSVRLENHPSIRSASVQRIPPKRIHIEIVERRPLAFYLTETGALMGLDAEGVALPPPASFCDPSPSKPISEAEAQTVLSLPMISGDLILPATPGGRIEDSHGLTVLSFLAQLQIQSPDFFREIVQGEFQKDRNFVLHMRRRIGVMILHDLHSPDLIKKILAFWRALEKEDLRAVYVDGRFPEKGFAVKPDVSQSAQWERLYKQHESIEAAGLETTPSAALRG